MKYDFEFAMSAQLSKNVVEEMIKSCVEQQTGRKVATVTINLKKVWRGGQRDEYQETIFEGATVHFFNNSKSV